VKLGSPDGSFVLQEWRDAGETHRGLPVAPLHVHHEEDEARCGLLGGFRAPGPQDIGERGSELL